MTLATFVNTLSQHSKKALLFEIAPQHYAGSHCHLTEIKTVQIQSVDCGGQSHQWTETHFQLWENPKEIGVKGYMTIQKVLDIVSKVDAIQPLNTSSELKIEYGNTSFPKAQLCIRSIVVAEQQLIVQLSNEQTKCKAPELCGVTETKSNSQTCTPESGCC
jgi:hypothetical protein